jgi:cytochrome c oxidase subunit II
VAIAIAILLVDLQQEALELEVLGQQWQWRFRLPGAGGKLCGSDVRFASGDKAALAS